jgi:hypothetical protein
MNKLSEEKVRKIVSRYGDEVKEIIPGFREPTAAESLANFIIPPDLENTLPQIGKGIADLRKELIQEVLNLPEDSRSEKNSKEIVKQLHSKYTDKLCQIGDPVEILRAMEQSQYVKDARETIAHNVTMQKKIVEFQNKQCAVCSDRGALQRCSRCKGVFYCSEACQKRDWTNGHKTVCKQHN